MTDETLPDKDLDYQDTPTGLDLTASRRAIVNQDDQDREPLERLGRKPHPINWDKVETAMSFGADLKMCAMYGGVHWNTLERRVLSRYGEGFKEVRAAFMTDRKAFALNQLWKLVGKGDRHAVLYANRVFNGLNDRPTKGREEDEDLREDFTFEVNYNLEKHPDVIEAEFKGGQDA